MFNIYTLLSTLSPIEHLIEYLLGRDILFHNGGEDIPLCSTKKITWGDTMEGEGGRGEGPAGAQP